AGVGVSCDACFRPPTHTPKEAGKPRARSARGFCADGAPACGAPTASPAPALCETDAHSGLAEPYPVAAARRAGGHDEIERGRDSVGGGKLETRATFREIADRARNSKRAVNDLPGFEHPHTLRSAAVLIHDHTDFAPILAGKYFGNFNQFPYVRRVFGHHPLTKSGPPEIGMMAAGCVTPGAWRLPRFLRIYPPASGLAARAGRGRGARTPSGGGGCDTRRIAS